MPDRFGDSNLQTLEVNIIPTKRQEFADPQPASSKANVRYQTASLLRKSWSSVRSVLKDDPLERGM